MLGRLKCRVGSHQWEQRQNLEVGGSAGVFHVCSRCGREKEQLVVRELVTDGLGGLG